MTAYLIGMMHVSDPIAYGKYKQETPNILQKYQGKFLTRGGDTFFFEGNMDDRRVVVAEFPDIEHAKQFYYSDEYTKARRLRMNAADMALFVVEGFEGR